MENARRNQRAQLPIQRLTVGANLCRVGLVMLRFRGGGFLDTRPTPYSV